MVMGRYLHNSVKAVGTCGLCTQTSETALCRVPRDMGCCDIWNTPRRSASLYQRVQNGESTGPLGLCQDGSVLLMYACAPRRACPVGAVKDPVSMLVLPMLHAHAMSSN